MSYVTNVILVTGADDGWGKEGEGWLEDKYTNACVLIDHIAKKHPHSKRFERIGHRANTGGNKCLECDVFVGAVNHLDVDALLECFYAIKWENPEAVRLLLDTESDVGSTVYLATGMLYDPKQANVQIKETNNGR